MTFEAAVEHIGAPIDCTIPDVVTEADALPDEPGFGWRIGDWALRELEAIDENRRHAALQAWTIFVD